jgi:hypothetical protein
MITPRHLHEVEESQILNDKNGYAGRKDMGDPGSKVSGLKDLGH